MSNLWKAHQRTVKTARKLLKEATKLAASHGTHLHDTKMVIFNRRMSMVRHLIAVLDELKHEMPRQYCRKAGLLRREIEVGYIQLRKYGDLRGLEASVNANH